MLMEKDRSSCLGEGFATGLALVAVRATCSFACLFTARLGLATMQFR